MWSVKGAGGDVWRKRAGSPPLPSGQHPHLQVQQLLMKAENKVVVVGGALGRG